MDIILPENVFDSRLESRCDSATNLFDCLAPENMNDNGIQATLEDSDVSEQVDQLLSDMEMVANEKQSIEPNSEELAQSGTECESQCSDSPSTENANEFIPTIIDIRGACDDSSEKLGNRRTIPADSTDTNSNSENDTTCIIENDDDEDVHTISDNEDSSDCDRTNSRSDVAFNDNVVIKQEPLDDDVDNDCMLVNSEGTSGCFTSEIEIKEERINENYDNEVRCVETTSKIPLPIPIKIEANFESEHEVSKSEPQKLRKSSRQAEYSSSSSKSLTDKSSSKNASAKLYPSSAYRCHLCNTTFEEHELLNEHMKLHRNNSLIERYNKSHGKQRNKSKYICRTCGKRLSTGQSLSQHMMIHNNEKPHVCPICKKDFRHLSNFKMHVQKHKEEEEQRRKQREKPKHAKKTPAPLPAPADRSVARSADFGRLVGPLFVKESLLKNSSSSDISRPMITPKTEYRKPYELKYSKVAKHDSAKENLIYYKKMTSSTSRSYDEKYSRARKFNDDIGDDVIPLKTFNNVENIVMNATKFIVKVDNLDANLLKKKIKTPDISIDKSATSIHKLASDRKRRIQLSPSADGSKRLKLDQIENIIMDSGDTSSTSVHDDTEDNDADDDLDLPTYYDDDDDTTATPPPVEPGRSKQETLTTNELFELLNDDRDSKEAPAEQPSPKKSPAKVNDRVSETVSPAPTPAVVKTPPKSSNVIVLKSTPPKVRSPAKLPSPPAPLIIDEPIPISKQITPTKSPRVETPPRVAVSPSTSIKSIDLTKDTPPKEPENKPVHLVDENDADEDDVQADKCDMYDSAFRNVALRRLTLIRKKAAQNGGKVENKYLLGPLFWRKAVRKAQRNQITREPAMTLNEAKLAFKRINAVKFGKQDTRRTNDAAKLQQRAELKLQYILGRIKVMNDVSHLNLTGPLFWKRTLKLAGIHNPNDLRRLLIDDRLTINDVEFIATKVTEPSTEVEFTTSTASTSVAEMNGDVTTIDDDDSNSSVVNNNLDNVEDSNLDNNPAQVINRNTLDEIPSPILISSPEKSVKSPVALTGSDFLESIVIRNKTSQPITNGSRKSIVDGILNDDLLKPKTLDKPAPLLMTTPILTKVPQLSSVQVLKSTADSTKEPVRRTVTKAESILYDSLTKPRVTTPTSSPTSTATTTTIPTPIIRSNQTFDSNSRTKSDLGAVPQPKPNLPIRRTPAANRSLLKSNNWAAGVPKKTPRGKAKPPPQPPPEPENRVVSLITSSTPPAAPATVAIVADPASNQIEVPDSTTALEAAGNIILNVDSADFQLIADSKNENGQETNYVLLSDGNGGVQLIKENDFRLLEDAGAASNASHYIVNVPGEENFANFDLMSNATGANSEQLAYIQLDGENYTTLQFIQDAAAAGVALEDPITGAASVDVDKQKILAAGEKNVTIGGTNYVIAADPSTDLNHIGKELSDFLHIDYGTLLKNDNQHQQT